MVSEWIARYRRPLRVLWVVFLLIWITELIVLRNTGNLNHLEYVLIFVTPFFLLGVVHLTLMYASWFKPDAATGFITTVKRGFFWVLSAAFVIIVVVLVGRYMPGLHT